MKSSPSWYYHFWVRIAKHAQSIQNKFTYLHNVSRKNVEMKLIFCLQINTKVFYKLIVSLWVCLAKHAQSTQKNKLAMPLQYLKENIISWQYLKKKVSDEFDFLKADKHESFLQIDTMILMSLQVFIISQVSCKLI